MDTLVILALGALAIYLGACAIWPYCSCRRCLGTGKHRSPSGKNWRQCRRCRGSDRRVRLGRRVYDATRHGHERW
jgi:hypothetical protein